VSGPLTGALVPKALHHSHFSLGRLVGATGFPALSTNFKPSAVQMTVTRLFLSVPVEAFADESTPVIISCMVNHAIAGRRASDLLLRNRFNMTVIVLDQIGKAIEIDQVGISFSRN